MQLSPRVAWSGRAFAPATFVPDQHARRGACSISWLQSINHRWGRRPSTICPRSHVTDTHPALAQICFSLKEIELTVLRMFKPGPDKYSLTALTLGTLNSQTRTQCLDIHFYLRVNIRFTTAHSEKLHLMPTSISYFVWLRWSCAGKKDFEPFNSATEVTFMLLSSVSNPRVNNFWITIHASMHYSEQHQFSAITSVAQPIHLRTHILLMNDPVHGYVIAGGVSDFMIGHIHHILIKSPISISLHTMCMPRLVHTSHTSHSEWCVYIDRSVR